MIRKEKLSITMCTTCVENGKDHSQPPSFYFTFKEMRANAKKKEVVPQFEIIGE